MTVVYHPGSPVPTKPPEPDCENCRRLLAGLREIAETPYGWKATALAKELLEPPAEP